MHISLKEAQAFIELARVHAEKIGVPMNIAVVDGSATTRVRANDKAILGSIDIALKKAKTSVLFNGPSEVYGNTANLAAPHPRPRARMAPHPVRRGLPIRGADGSLNGAIGVSGGMPEQDGEVARTGIAGRQ